MYHPTSRGNLLCNPRDTYRLRHYNKSGGPFSNPILYTPIERLKYFYRPDLDQAAKQHEEKKIQEEKAAQSQTTFNQLVQQQLIRQRFTKQKARNKVKYQNTGRAQDRLRDCEVDGDSGEGEEHAEDERVHALQRGLGHSINTKTKMMKKKKKKKKDHDESVHIIVQHATKPWQNISKANRDEYAWMRPELSRTAIDHIDKRVTEEYEIEKKRQQEKRAKARQIWSDFQIMMQDNDLRDARIQATFTSNRRPISAPPKRPGTATMIRSNLSTLLEQNMQQHYDVSNDHAQPIQYKITNNPHANATMHNTTTHSGNPLHPAALVDHTSEVSEHSDDSVCDAVEYDDRSTIPSARNGRPLSSWRSQQHQQPHPLLHSSLNLDLSQPLQEQQRQYGQESMSGLTTDHGLYTHRGRPSTATRRDKEQSLPPSQCSSHQHDQAPPSLPSSQYPFTAIAGSSNVSSSSNNQPHHNPDTYFADEYVKSCGPGNTLSSQTFVATAIREIEDDEEDGDGKSDYSSTDSVPDAYQPTVLISERDSTWVEHTGFVSNRGYNKKQLKYVVSPHLDALSKPKDKYKNPKRLPYNHQDYRHLRAKSNSRTIGNEGARNSDSVHATRRGTSAHTRTLPSYRRGSAKRRGQRGGSALALASGMRGKASRPSSSPVYLRSLAQSRSMTASRLHHTPSQQRQQQQQQQEQEPATGDDVSLAEYQQSVRQLLADKQALATRTAIKERGAVSDARHAYLNTWKGQSEEKYSVRRKSLAEKEAFHEEQQARAQAGGAENVPCDSNNPDAQNTVQTRTTTKEKKKSKSSSKSEIEYRVSAWELNEELTCMDQLDAFEKQLSLSQKEGQTRRAKYTLEHGKLRHQVRTLGGNEAVRVLRKDLKSDNRDTTLWRQPRMYDY